MGPRSLAYVVGLALVLVLGFIAHLSEAEHFWEKLPIFEALFGFFGCLFIIVMSKALGRLFIQKKEDYYDD
jgi:hypothetical protein